MPRYIDANKKLHIQVYDDMHEEFTTVEKTIADCLDCYSDEGCPESADVEEVERGEWEEVKHREDALVLHSYLKCSCCGTEFHASLMAGCCADIKGDGYLFPRCPNCGAIMDGKKGEKEDGKL